MDCVNQTNPSCTEQGSANTVGLYSKLVLQYKKYLRLTPLSTDRDYCKKNSSGLQEPKFDLKRRQLEAEATSATIESPSKKISAETEKCSLSGSSGPKIFDPIRKILLKTEVPIFRFKKSDSLQILMTSEVF